MVETELVKALALHIPLSVGFILIMLAIKNQKIVRAQMFLRYRRVKNAFYVGFLGSAILLSGSVLSIFLLSKFIFNLSMVVFHVLLTVCILLFYTAVKGKRSDDL